MTSNVSDSNRTWRKIAIPVTLIAGLTAGAIFGPASIASADESADREAIKEERRAAVAECAGVTVEELEAGFEADQPVADIASVTRDELVSCLVVLGEAKIDQAVTDERLTQDEAEDKKAELPAKIEERVDTPPSENDGKGKGNRQGKKTGVATTDA